MPASRIAALCPILLGLAACAEPTTRPAYVYDAYELGVLSGPAAEGGMAAYVVGDPFPGRAAEVDAVVEHALTEQRFGPAFPVTTTPAPELQESAYKVVVVFDPPTQWDGYRICKHDELPESIGRQGAEIEVLAIFCEGHRLMTSTQGHVAAADSPDDPRFRALMEQVALTLFPPLRWQRNLDRDIEMGGL